MINEDRALLPAGHRRRHKRFRITSVSRVIQKVTFSGPPRGVWVSPPPFLNPEKTVDVTYHRLGRDKRNKLLMARGDSLDLSLPPVVIFYERRPERVQHALKCLLPTYVCMCARLYLCV